MTPTAKQQAILLTWHALRLKHGWADPHWQITWGPRRVTLRGGLDFNDPDFGTRRAPTPLRIFEIVDRKYWADSALRDYLDARIDGCADWLAALP